MITEDYMKKAIHLEICGPNVPYEPQGGRLTKERLSEITRNVVNNDVKTDIRTKIADEMRLPNANLALVELWQTQLKELDEFGEIRTTISDSEVRAQ
jgi:hypothetical protein